MLGDTTYLSNSNNVSNIKEHFSSLISAQENLETELLLNPPADNKISLKPIVPIVEYKKSKKLPKQLLSSSQGIPEVVKQGTMFFTQESLSVKFKTKNYQPIDIVIPQSHYEQPKGEAELDPEILKQEDNQIDKEKFMDEAHFSKPPKNSLSGRQLCGIMFSDSEFSSPVVNLSGFVQTASSSVEDTLFIRLRSIDFEGTLVSNLEPYFITFALYNIAGKRKLSEDIHMDLNTPAQLELLQNAPRIPSAATSGGAVVEPETINPLTTLRQALFTINLQDDVSQAYLVFRISKVCQQDSDAGISDYLNSPEKVQKARGKDANSRDVEKVKKAYNENTKGLGQFRQLFAFGFVKVWEDKKWNKQIFRDREWPEDTMKCLEFGNVYRYRGTPDEKTLIESIDLASKKPGEFKLIPCSMSLDVMHLQNTRAPNTISPQLSEEGMAVQDDTADEQEKPLNSELTELKEPIRMVQSFLNPKLPLTFRSFYHFLYVYPDCVDFTGKIASERARNICIDIRLKNSDESTAERGEPVLYGGSHSAGMVDHIVTSMTYHERKPHFIDEIKIALPFQLTDRTHLLFTFYHISYQAAVKEDKKKDRQILNIIGYSVLPLTSESHLRQSFVQLQVAASLERGYMSLFSSAKTTSSSSPLATSSTSASASSGSSDLPVAFLSDGKPLFSVSLSLVSTIIPQNAGIRDLLANSEKDEAMILSSLRNYGSDALPPHMAGGSSSQGTSTGISSLSDYLQMTSRSAENSSGMEGRSTTGKKDMDAVIYFPTIANILFRRLLKFPQLQRISVVADLLSLLKTVKYTTGFTSFKQEIPAEYLEEKLDPIGVGVSSAPAPPPKPGKRKEGDSLKRSASLSARDSTDSLVRVVVSKEPLHLVLMKAWAHILMECSWKIMQDELQKSLLASKDSRSFMSSSSSSSSASAAMLPTFPANVSSPQAMRGDLPTTPRGFDDDDDEGMSIFEQKIEIADQDENATKKAKQVMRRLFDYEKSEYDGKKEIDLSQLEKERKLAEMKLKELKKDKDNDKDDETDQFDFTSLADGTTTSVEDSPHDSVAARAHTPNSPVPEKSFSPVPTPSPSSPHTFSGATMGRTLSTGSRGSPLSSNAYAAGRGSADPLAVSIEQLRDYSKVKPYLGSIKTWMNAALILYPEVDMTKVDQTKRRIDFELWQHTLENNWIFPFIAPPSKSSDRMMQGTETLRSNQPTVHPQIHDHIHFGWFFFGAVIKSMIITKSRFDAQHGSAASSSASASSSTEPSEKVYEDPFTPEFYSVLKSFVLFHCVLMKHSKPTQVRFFVSELATFLTHLWTVADRGKVNELILLFLTYYAPDAETQTEVERKQILGAILNFWTIITSSEHWVPMCLISKVSEKVKKEKGFVYFLPHILVKSLFACQQQIVDMDEKKRETPADYMLISASPVQERGRGPSGSETLRGGTLRGTLRPGAAGGEGSSATLKTSQVLELDVPDIHKGGDGMDDDLGGDMEFVDVDGFKKAEEANADLRPFHLYREMLTRIDTDKKYNSVTCRMTISWINYSFMQTAMEKKQLIDRAGKIRLSEQYDCVVSCLWLLRNSKLSVYHRFLSHLQLEQYPSLISLLAAAVELFRVENVTKFLKSLNPSEQMSKNVDNVKKKLEEMQATVAGGHRARVNFRDKKKDLTLRYHSRNAGAPSSLSVSSSAMGTLPRNSSGGIDDGNTLSLASLGTMGRQGGTIKLYGGTGSIRFSKRASMNLPLTSLGNPDEDQPSSSSSPSTSALSTPQSQMRTLHSSFPSHTDISKIFTPPSPNSPQGGLSNSGSTAELGGTMNARRMKDEAVRKMLSASALAEAKEQPLTTAAAEQEGDNYYKALDLMYIVSETICAAIGEFSAFTSNKLLSKKAFKDAHREQLGMFLGDQMSFEILSKHFKENPKERTAIRWNYNLSNCEKERENYQKFACNSAHHSLQETWNLLLKLFAEKQSEEASASIFNLIYFLIKTGGQFLLVEKKEALNKLTEILMERCKSSFQSVRENAVLTLYSIMKMNYMLTSGMSRPQSIFTLCVFRLASANTFEEEAIKQSYHSLSNLCNIDPEQAPDFNTKCTGICSRLLTIFEESAVVKNMKDIDNELTADLRYSLVQSYRHSPELCVTNCTTLKDLMQTISCLDEAAVAQVVKCAIILDIYTADLRENPDSCESVTYPQYLPIRSDFAKLDGQGNLQVLTCEEVIRKQKAVSGDSSSSSAGFIPAAPIVPKKRRYGASWVAWDVLLKEIIPHYKLYRADELIHFVGNTDAASAIRDSRDFVIEKCVDQLEEAAKLLSSAHMYEYVIPVKKILVAFYQALNDLPNLQRAWSELAEPTLKSIIEIPIKGRVQTNFYFIGLYGKVFEKENGNEYIIKEYNFKKIGDVKHGLIAKYQKRFGIQPTVLSERPTSETMDKVADGLSFFLTAVDPYFDETEVNDRRTGFSRITNVSNFFFDNTFTKPKPEDKEQKKRREPHMHEVFLRRTICRTEQPLPFCTRRVPIKSGGMEIKVFSPAQKCSQDVQSKVDQMKFQMNPLDEKALLTTIKGAIATEVNAGPMAIFDCFLEQHKDETDEADQDLVKATFHVFFLTCREALIKLCEASTSVGLLEELVQKYNGLVEKVRGHIGDIPLLQQGIDY